MLTSKARFDRLACYRLWVKEKEAIALFELEGKAMQEERIKGVFLQIDFDHIGFQYCYRMIDSA